MNDSEMIGPRGNSVLVVDDNPENLRVLGAMLRERGYKVRIAPDGTEALRSIEASAPDIVLLDIHMPGMDGYEVCKRLKANPRLRDIPVLFLSALNETFNKVLAYGSGGADYITKPFQFEEVHARIEAHLKTRRLLSESDTAFRSSFEQAAVGMAHLKIDGTFMKVNSKLCGMLGYAEGELLGLSLRDIAPPERRHAFTAELAAAAQQEDGSVTEERQYVRRDGTAIWCGTTLSMVHVPSAGIRYLAAIFVDISERKHAEERLRESEEHYRTFLMDLPVGACRCALGKNGRFMMVNPALVDMFGYKSAEELLAVYPEATFFDPLQMRQFVGQIDSRGHAEGFTLTLVRKDGTPFTARVWARPLGSGPEMCGEAVVIDVTELASLEARLQQAQKMEAIGTLAGGIAHDFNNILSAILGYSDLAMADLPEDSEVRQSLAEVIRAGTRAKELVAQILAFSRRADRIRGPIRLHSAVEEALKLLRASIPSTVEVKTDIRTDGEPVMADPTDIHQILMNLGTNAYHAMREQGGELTVKLDQVQLTQQEAERDPELKPGKYARLQVRDTGQGMNKEVQKRIFEPYFTTKERGEGTGLGLATVHGVVKDLGGSIHFYSEAGTGTLFSVLLPLASAGQTGTPEGDPFPSSGLEGKERILLVDDEEAILRFAQNALERLGYQVTIRSGAEEALETFRAAPEQFDVIVTDQMMPKMKGTELATKLTTLRRDIPIILCSGFGEGMRETKPDTPIRDYIMKPIIASDLARAVRKVLTRSDAGER